jgi:hypothetical protein
LFAYSEAVNREELLRTIIEAASIDALRATGELGRRWMAANPEDPGVAMAMESIYLAVETYRLEEPFCEPSL